MLLASALPCDSGPLIRTKPPRPILQRFMPYSGSSTEGIPTLSTLQETVLAPVVDRTVALSCSSPLLSPSSISSGIQSTCRALQSLLGVTPSPGAEISPRRKVPIPSPSPRRSRSPQTQENHIIHSPIPIRPSMPTRGRNKRSRDEYESTPRQSESMDVNYSVLGHRNSYDSGYQGSNPSDTEVESTGLPIDIKQFSTPKRRKRLPGPECIPFGLAQQDFIDLDVTLSEPVLAEQPGIVEDEQVEQVEEEWSSLHDASLISMVLDKLHLSTSDWNECARVLGVNGEGRSLGKRWKWLMAEGRIGLKPEFGERSRFEGRRMGRRDGRGDCRSIF